VIRGHEEERQREERVLEGEREGLEITGGDEIGRSRLSMVELR
jgi:hypothetical protein